MPLSEETIKEIVLLNIADRLRGHVAILPFNKRQEGKIGADWEWCLFDEGSQLYFRILVQAKILDDKSSEYPHLDHKIGTSGVRQIDRLIEVARARSVPPIYAFYNWGRAMHFNEVHQCNRYHHTGWGVSIADAYRVRGNLAGPDAKKFDAIAPFSIPWHLLTCCCDCRLIGPRGNVTKTVSRALNDLRGRERIFVADSELPSIEQPTQVPPDYAEAALSALRGEPPSEERMAQLRKQNSDIDGVLFIRSAPADWRHR